MSRQNIGLNRPGGVEKVIKVELSGKNLRLRLILVILSIIVGVGAFIYGFMQLLSSGDGWNEITTNSQAEINCGEQFIFEYCLGQSGVSATAEAKALKMIYTEACTEAYNYFNIDESFLETKNYVNVRDINDHPNEELTVPDALYQAFSLLKESGNRLIYLGPVYSYYENIFSAPSLEDTIEFDPLKNPEIAAYYKEIADFAGSPAMIDIVLLGDNKICLKVSEEYLSYAKKEGITDFIDFNWMKNAFITDYLADTMIKNGYSYGSISSFDGFSRCLDDHADRSYQFNLYDLFKNTVYHAATLSYSGRYAISYLRSYPMNAQDRFHYLEMEDGSFRQIYLSVKDGKPSCQMDNLVSLKKDGSCAEVLLSQIPLFMEGEGSPMAPSDALVSNIWFEDTFLRTNDESLMIGDLYKGEVSFSK